MPQPPKRPPVTRQAHAGGVVSPRPYIAGSNGPEAVLPVFMGVDFAKPGAESVVVFHPSRNWGKTAAQKILQDERDGMTAAQFRELYEGRPEPCAVNCQCKACVRYRREQESQP